MMEKETDLYNKIIQASNVINNKNRSVGDYFIMNSKSAEALKNMIEEYENFQRIEALRKLRKQKLEKIKETRNNL